MYWISGLDGRGRTADTISISSRISDVVIFYKFR